MDLEKVKIHLQLQEIKIHLQEIKIHLKLWIDTIESHPTTISSSSCFLKI